MHFSGDYERRGYPSTIIWDWFHIMYRGDSVSHSTPLSFKVFCESRMKLALLTSWLSETCPPLVIQSPDHAFFIPPQPYQLASFQICKSTRSELTLPQWFLSGDINKQLVKVHICLVLQWKQNTDITTLSVFGKTSQILTSIQIA